MSRVGFGPRFVASIIDMFLSVVIGVVLAFTQIFSKFNFSSSTYFSSKEFMEIEESLKLLGSDIKLIEVQCFILSFFAATMLYSLIEGITGASPGKRIQKIVIANDDGSEGDIVLFMSRWSLKNIANLITLVMMITGLLSLKIASSLLAWVVFFGCLLVLANHKQALHDKIVKSAVYES